MTEAAAKPAPTEAEFLLQQIVNAADLGGLTPDTRVKYYAAVCESVGLNPLTKPFDFMSLNGKTVLYAKRECTDQLRKLHHIDIQIMDRIAVEGVYVVTARATMPNKRQDESTGAVSLRFPKVYKNKKGEYIPHPKAGQDVDAEDKANAMMKAETKAKRRVTLSIVGLGVLDESEIDGITGDYPEAGASATPALEGPAKKSDATQAATPAASTTAAATATASQTPPAVKEATAPASPVEQPVVAAPNAEPATKAAAPAAPAATESGELMPDNRIKTFEAKMKAAGIDEAKFVAKFGKKITSMLKSQSAEIQAFIEGK